MKILDYILPKLQIFEKKQHHSAQLSLTTQPQQAIWNQNNYHHYCQEGYRKNPIVYSCIRMTADGAAKIPLKLYIDDKKIDKHPIKDLLRGPNPSQSGFAFRAQLFGYLQISGDSYIDIVSLDRKSRPKELYNLHPDRVKIIADPKGYISHYQYQIPNFKERILHKDNMVHLKYFSPDCDYYGQAPLAAAMRSNDIHNKAADFQKSLLDNSARPSGCLVYNGGGAAPNLSDEQFTRLKTELEDHYTGTKSAGRPMVLEGGLDWKPMSFSPADMEFSNLRHNTARDIALAFGVPPMMLGIPGDNTYSNYQEAVRVFTRNSLLPMSEMLCDQLSRKFSLLYNENIRLIPDVDGLAALLPERESYRDFISKATFLSKKEKKEILL